jgi:hypothetical protein
VGGEPEGVGATGNTMLYDVLVVSKSGGEERFTTERDAPLSVGDIVAQEADSYRVLAIQPGHGPFDGVVEAEWPRSAARVRHAAPNSGSRSTPASGDSRLHSISRRPAR